MISVKLLLLSFVYFKWNKSVTLTWKMDSVVQIHHRAAGVLLWVSRSARVRKPTWPPHHPTRGREANLPRVGEAQHFRLIPIFHHKTSQTFRFASETSWRRKLDFLTRILPLQTWSFSFFFLLNKLTTLWNRHVFMSYMWNTMIRYGLPLLHVSFSV